VVSRFCILPGQLVRGSPDSPAKLPRPAEIRVRPRVSIFHTVPAPSGKGREGLRPPPVLLLIGCLPVCSVMAECSVVAKTPLPPLEASSFSPITLTPTARREFFQRGPSRGSFPVTCFVLSGRFSTFSKWAVRWPDELVSIPVVVSRIFSYPLLWAFWTALGSCSWSEQDRGMVFRS